MKYEWRKEEKSLYGAKAKPEIVQVPAQHFISIRGKGNPNNEDFSQRIGALMSLAYPIKMNYKNAFCAQIENPVYTDFTVFPLEGVWTSSDRDISNKDAFEYTIMIKQPNVIKTSMFKDVLAATKKKKGNDLLDEIVFSSYDEELCVQILHVGPYDTEPESFKIMDKYIEENGFRRKNEKEHREIYLSDFRRVDPDKLKTILRYQIENQD